MTLKRLTGSLLIVAAMVALAACGSSSGSSNATASGSPGSASPAAKGGSLAGKTIWYAGVLDANPAEYAMAQGINKAVTDAGGKMIRSLAVNPSTGNFEIAAHTQGFVRAIAAKPAAIIFFDITPQEMGPQVKQARKAGIPVFAFAGHPAPGVDVNAWLDFDGVSTGKQVATYMADHLPSGSKVTMIGAAAGITVAENFIQAALGTFKAKGLAVIGNEDSQRNPIDNAAGGQKSMQGILRTVPDANAVLAYNDDSALGAISAAKAAHKEPGKAIFIGSRNGGPDAVAAVKAGTLMVSCDVDPIGFGEKIGQAAVDQVTGKHDYENAIKIAPLSSSGCLIDKDTVGSYVNWTNRIKYAKLTEK